jgi:hypothetical protein
LRVTRLTREFQVLVPGLPTRGFDENSDIKNL